MLRVQAVTGHGENAYRAEAPITQMAPIMTPPDQPPEIGIALFFENGDREILRGESADFMELASLAALIATGNPPGMSAPQVPVRFAEGIGNVATMVGQAVETFSEQPDGCGCADLWDHVMGIQTGIMAQLLTTLTTIRDATIENATSEGMAERHADLMADTAAWLATAIIQTRIAVEKEQESVGD